MENKKIAILGAGGIGRAVALILGEWSEDGYDIYLGDAFPETADSAGLWIKEGLTNKSSTVKTFVMPKEGTNSDLDSVLSQCHIVLDCLPGSQAPRIARLAKQFKLHYVNLTEYVKETEEIMEIAKDAETGFVLQAGLAPGFINILANGIYQDFRALHNVDKVDYIGMKVGALTQNARAPHFYGFTWSPIGVATEYVKDAWAIRDFKKVSLPALTERKTIIVDGGLVLEEDLTSGGAADMPDSFASITRDLDYKTLRFPGHYAWAESIMSDKKDIQERINALENEMLETVPRVEEDMVVVYACVEGKDSNGVLRASEETRFIYPQMVGNHILRAIQTTTAAPMAECARMLLEDRWTGVVFQSQIDPEEFMDGTFVSKVYDEEDED